MLEAIAHKRCSSAAVTHRLQVTNIGDMVRSKKHEISYAVSADITSLWPLCPYSVEARNHSKPRDGSRVSLIDGSISVYTKCEFSFERPDTFPALRLRRSLGYQQ